jgi:non-ribosomal peptide synthetase component F
MIGGPVRAVSASIWDRFLRPVPVGAPGELYISECNWRAAITRGAN